MVQVKWIVCNLTTLLAIVTQTMHCFASGFPYENANQKTNVTDEDSNWYL